jgi:rare lipoprotein A
LASWYGPGFHGRKTASGETFDQDAQTAAHRTLPFGTRVRVVRLDTGDDVVVRVNDRGPFVRNRVIDLSRGAARRVGLDRDGVARVVLRVESWPEDAVPAVFTVQVGAFREEGNAERLRERLKERWDDVEVVRFYEFHRVRVGHFATESEAEDAGQRLEEALAADQLLPFVTRAN